MWCAACAAEGITARPCPTCGDDPLLDGRYSLEKVLGKGSRGTTWLAIRVSDGEHFAAKETQLHAIDEPKVRELVSREASVLRQLEHPAIPRHVEDLVTSHGRTRSVWLVQEYIKGADLQSSLAEKRYSEHEVLEIIAELCGVLSYLHSLSPPIIHRDIKPANVIRRPSGELVLADFGAVRDAMKDPRTGGSTVAGTFGYMAPEQFAGDASPKTDLYGLGALAVALLSRQDPSTLLGSDRVMRYHSAVSLSAPAKALLDSLLQIEPTRRPANVNVVRQRIIALLARNTSTQSQSSRNASAATIPPSLVVPAKRPVTTLQKQRETWIFSLLSLGFFGVSVGGAVTSLIGMIAGIGGTVIGAIASIVGTLLTVIFAIILLIATEVPHSQPPPRSVPATHWPVIDQRLYDTLPATTITCPSNSDSVRCPHPFAVEAEREMPGRAIFWSFTKRPAQSVLVAKSGSYTLGPTPAQPHDEGSLWDSLEWVEPIYPEEADSISITSVQCEVDVYLLETGIAYRADISGCPLAMHTPIVDAIRQSRWASEERPTLVHRTVTFTARE